MLYQFATCALFLASLLNQGLAGTINTKIQYNKHSVLRCHPENNEQLAKLHDIEEGTNHTLNLDFWLETRRTTTPVDIMVSGEERPMLEKMLDSIDVNCREMVADVQALVEKEAAQIHQAKLTGSSYFESYHTWTEVHEYIEGLASEFSSLSTVSTIGKTYEGKPIKIITLSTKPGAGKPTLWYDGGLHAREWVTVSTVTYLADFILRGYGKDADATTLLDTYDVIICPILNIDGYDYTWTTDRMWRKTRSPNPGAKCDGTDPNRNWAYHWGEAGASPVPCSDSYQGPSAASEVEVQAVQSYLYSIRANLKSYINFHSYSQLWMSNWGYTYDLPADYEAQNGLSAVAVAAIKATHGKVYDYGPIAETIYPASGSSADYTYGVCGVKYSYGVELRDTGEFGFLLPPQEIVPSGEEIWAAVVAMGQYIQQNP